MLGTRLRRVRLSKGLTQREVAAPTYTHAYISTIEAGRRHPSPAALRHFADRLGVDVEDLTTGRPPGLVAELEGSLAEARVAASDGRVDRVETSLASVERRARRHRLRRLEARSHEIRALSLERSGSMETALEEYERAEDILGEEPPAARAEAVTGKARCLQILGDVRYPIFVLESLQRQMQGDPPDPDASAQVMASLIDAYLDAGLVRAADDLGEQLERILPRVQSELRRGQACMYLARLRASQNRPRDADRMLASAEEAYERAGFRTETGYAHLARGILQSRAGKYVRAHKELERARQIFEETGNAKELGNTLIELSRVERLRGDVDAAAALLDNALDRLRGSDGQLLAWAHREYGLLFADRDVAVAEKHLRAALDLFDRGEEHVETATTYRMLGDVLRSDGQEEAAFEAYAAGIHRLPASP
jgi:tetratricopeptide (TPR) repeat protein